MIDFLCLAYLVGGLALGLIVQPAARTVLRTWKKLKTKKPKMVIDSNTLIRCGECRSLVTVGPYFRQVTDAGDMLVYRCQQCGQNVSVQI